MLHPSQYIPVHDSKLRKKPISTLLWIEVVLLYTFLYWQQVHLSNADAV